MIMAKHNIGDKASARLPRASRIAVKADLSAPSFSALDRVGSSLRHCFHLCSSEKDDLDELLKKLG